MLEKIKIASPCKASWEQMAGDERIRHCAECDLDVYNFSAMTRRDVERLVRERKGRLCARFYLRPDGTMLTQDCPVGFRARVRRVSRVAGAAIAAAMSTMPAWAQTKAADAGSPLVQIDQADVGIRLHVVATPKTAVPNARVTLVKIGSKEDKIGTTDADGNVSFFHLKPGLYFVTVEHPDFGQFKEAIAVPAKDGSILTIDVVETVEMGMVAPIADHRWPSELGTGAMAPAPRAFPRGK